MRKLAITVIAAAFMAVTVSLPRLQAQVEMAPLNPQGTLKPEPFADVPPDHWAYNAVESMRRLGLMEGFPDGTFIGKRPVTRYELAQMTARMITGLLGRIRDTRGVPTAGGVSQEDLNQELQKLRDQMLTREQVQQMIQEALDRRPTTPSGDFVTRQELQTLQRLVDEFRPELTRLQVDVEAVKRQLADLTARVDAIEAELDRLPRIVGSANIIAKGDMKSDQLFNATAGTFRPAFGHDFRPLNDDTNLLTPLLGWYDLDLGIVARPFADVRVGTALNIGNYVPSYRAGVNHGYNETADDASAVTPYKVFVNVPFRVFGGETPQDLTLGLQGSQLTPFTFKAIDPDTYTYIPREDSGEVVFWGASTTWRFGGAKLRALAGTNPQDGRLLPLNVYTGAGPQGLATVFGGFAGSDLAGAPVGATAPIREMNNFAAVRLVFGEPEVSPIRAEELPVGTAEQLNITPATPSGLRQVAAAEATAPAAAEEAPVEEAGVTFGPFRNTIVGLNWLLAAGSGPRVDTTVGGVTVPGEDARAQILSADLRTNIWNFQFQAEGAFAQSDTGAINRPRALDDWAVDARAFYNIALGSAADLQLGGGYRLIELGYLTPGYWGVMGSWKNPRGIQGWLAEARVPLKWDIASFLRNMAFRASGEWYEGDEVPTFIGSSVIGTDPDEGDLRINRYLVGVQFGLTSDNTVDLGFEQVFRNYLGAAGAAPLALPTMGVGGSPLVGTRIKNTETYLNFGIGHNFTPDVAAKLLLQLADFQKYAVDVSNQPANYRGWVATAQAGVRF
ncbi:MAG: S-layer homology domain-containing protein [Armatimonadetes bacterium]|nr:S-layer homology domain-containing protein [Armatimonadota bacterium]